MGRGRWIGLLLGGLVVIWQVSVGDLFGVVGGLVQVRLLEVIGKYIMFDG